MLLLLFSLYFSHVVTQESTGRREALVKGATAFGAAFVPVAANAAAGESPRFSVFGLLGDGTAYSEGAAYGSDQAGKVYSPYSVYGESGDASLYKPGNEDYAARKKAVLSESKKRIAKLPAYIEKKKWFEVINELDRYMYETRGAVKGLAQTPEQKVKATAFFKAIEETNLNARLKNQDAAAAAAAASASTLDAFVASI